MGDFNQTAPNPYYQGEMEEIELDSELDLDV
jgi:hypothetical protein